MPAPRADPRSSAHPPSWNPVRDTVAPFPGPSSDIMGSDAPLVKTVSVTGNDTDVPTFAAATVTVAESELLLPMTFDGLTMLTRTLPGVEPANDTQGWSAVRVHDGVPAPA